MEMSTTERQPPFQGFNPVRLVFLKRFSDQINPKERLLQIYPTSTFEDIQEELFPEYHNQWTVLQTTFGPVPYWTRPEARSHIGLYCKTLYAVDSDECVLAVVRDSDSDYPILLNCDSIVQGGATICDIVASLTPDLKLASVTGYSTALRDDISGWLEDQKTKWHFPTVFILTTSDRPDGFEFASEPTPIFASMLFLYLDSKRLLQRSSSIKYCALQMINVSSALIHAVLSLEKLLEAPSSVNVDAKILEDMVRSISCAKTLGVPCSFCPEKSDVKVSEKEMGYRYPYKLVALNVASNLKKSSKELAEILKDLESESVTSARNEVASNLRRLFESRIEKVFLDLCGELPGAVTIRDSHTWLKRMKQFDEAEAKEGEEEEICRLSQQTALEMGARLLKRVWHVLFVREKPEPSRPPTPAWSFDEDLQDLQTGTPGMLERELKDLGAGATATLDPAANVY